MVPLHSDLSGNGVSSLIPLALSFFYLLHASLPPRFNEVSSLAISAWILFFTYIHFPFLFRFFQWRSISCFCLHFFSMIYITHVHIWYVKNHMCTCWCEENIDVKLCSYNSLAGNKIWIYEHQLILWCWECVNGMYSELCMKRLNISMYLRDGRIV